MYNLLQQETDVCSLGFLVITVKLGLWPEHTAFWTYNLDTDTVHCMGGIRLNRYGVGQVAFLTQTITEGTPTDPGMGSSYLFLRGLSPKTVCVLPDSLYPVKVSGG